MQDESGVDKKEEQTMRLITDTNEILRTLCIESILLNTIFEH